MAWEEVQPILEERYLRQNVQVKKNIITMTEYNSTKQVQKSLQKHNHTSKVYEHYIKSFPIKVKFHFLPYKNIF